MRFEGDADAPAKALMTRENLITVKEGVGQSEARDLLRRHKIERLIVVDDDYRAVGLITVKDMEKSEAHPNAAKDAHGRLLVGAASTVGDAGYERSMRSEEHTSELQSLMRISYAVFCLKKKNHQKATPYT